MPPFSRTLFLLFPLLGMLGSFLSPQALAAAIDSLDETVARHLMNHPTLSSLAAVVISEGELQGFGVAGARKVGDPTPVTIQDKYHIGSCTKAFTATLAAKLVEEGMIT